MLIIHDDHILSLRMIEILANHYHTPNILGFFHVPCTPLHRCGKWKTPHSHMISHAFPMAEAARNWTLHGLERQGSWMCLMTFDLG